MNILGLENINESLLTHFLIYKITNTVNGKYYIGLHKTDNPYDDYMGSGDYIKNAELKYGLSAFTKEILFDFNSFEEMNDKEKELVPLSACYPYNPMSYNLREGGFSGKFSIEARQHLSDTRIKLEIAKGKKNGMYGKDPWAKLSEQRKAEIRKEVSERNNGSKNPMFKYPYKLVVLMRDEYNITGYIGVKNKFGYTACEDKLRCLFDRNNLKYIRKSKHHKYSLQELLDAIYMINLYGFDYYATYASTKYAFRPLLSNFKKVLLHHNLLSALTIKL